MNSKDYEALELEIERDAQLEEANVLLKGLIECGGNKEYEGYRLRVVAYLATQPKEKK
jgi:hypothetical protein